MHSPNADWCNVSRSTLELFLGSRSLVKQVEIRLPANCHDTAEYAPVLDGYVGEAKGSNSRPDLAAVPPAGGHCVSDALDDFGKGGTGEQGLHTEEVGIEQWGEECLVDEDLSESSVCVFCNYVRRRRTLMDRESVLDL
jgi:hypothetical protein